MAVPYLGYAQASIEQGNPFQNLVRGYGTAQTLQQNQMKLQTEQMALQQAKAKQEALKGYGQTGDVDAAMQKDPATGMALQKYQIEMGEAATKNWDENKWTLTREGYPKFRDNQIKQFGKFAETHLPPAETFKTDEDFYKFKTQKEEAVAKFKSFLTPYQAARLGIEQQKVEQKGQMTPYQQGMLGVAAGRLGIEQGKLGDKPKFSDYIKDPEIAKLPYNQQVARFNEDTKSKVVDPVKARNDFDKANKYTVDIADNYEKRASAEILGSKTYKNTGWTGKDQLSYAELPPERQRQEQSAIKGQVAKLAKENFDRDMDAKFAARQKGQGGGQGKPAGGKPLTQMSDAEIQQMINAKKAAEQ